MNLKEFYTGNCFDAYEFLGCHLTDDGAVFRTYAPKAASVSVIGEFNNWCEQPMARTEDGRFFEMFSSEAKAGQMYRFVIHTEDGRSVDHSDPYGFGMERRPNSASIIRDMNAFSFEDEKWMKSRTTRLAEALNIYEMHAGSWKANPDDEEEGWYTYRELAGILVPYLLEHGYNYVEFMPLSEHPCDNSWGYQNTGFFSPTSRYGTADDLKFLINELHKNGIGVILDFVPVHFAVDGYGLINYDGTALYEYPHPDIGYNEWGSCNFNHSKGEVQSFLMSNANYWLTEYHFDGLRIDALANMIYWQGEEARGENENAIEFIKKLNCGLKARHPSAILAAEDSTHYPKVTRPVFDGGLGFDYKWDMGWMNDTLNFMQKTPEERKKAYHKLTFSMMYYYDENFILPLSHDEVVHGKATIVQKMCGLYEGKFPQARALYMYMYAHPGKKLNFMGNEIAQLREWDETREQDWDMLKYPLHDSFSVFMKDLSHVYLDNPAFSALDYITMGFDWVDCHSEDKCLYSFVRSGGDQHILCVFNFSEKTQEYKLKLDYNEKLTLLLASDNEIYSGTVHYDGGETVLKKDGVFDLEMTPYSAKFFITD